MSTEVPFEICTLEGDLAKKFPEVAENMVSVGPKKACFRNQYRNFAGDIYNFKARPNDVWVYGYPRSGTTMSQEIIWLIANDLNYEGAQKRLQTLRFPFLDLYPGRLNPESFDHIKNNPDKYDEHVLESVKSLRYPPWVRLEKQKDKRFIKTHAPFSLGPKNVLQSGCKIFYLARNPKDVIISRYQLGKSLGEIPSVAENDENEFKRFWDAFKRGLIIWTPYFEHLKEGWEASKTNPNVLFLFYEDYKKDMKGTLQRIATHLDKTLTDKQLDTLEKHMKIDNFRENKSVNLYHLKILGIIKDNKPDSFIRKGKANGWMDFLSDSISAEMDLWIETNLKQNGFEDFQFPKV